MGMRESYPLSHFKASSPITKKTKTEMDHLYLLDIIYNPCYKVS